MRTLEYEHSRASAAVLQAQICTNLNPILHAMIAWLITSDHKTSSRPTFIDFHKQAWLASLPKDYRWLFHAKRRHCISHWAVATHKHALARVSSGRVLPFKCCQPLPYKAGNSRTAPAKGRCKIDGRCARKRTSSEQRRPHATRKDKSGNPRRNMCLSPLPPL